jgi:hypothetical protein
MFIVYFMTIKKRGGSRKSVALFLWWLFSSSGAADDWQPQPRLWGLRQDHDKGEGTAAFLNPFQMMMNINSRPTSSALKFEQDKKSRDKIDFDEEDKRDASTLFRQRSKDEWIDGRTMMQLFEIENAREEQERLRQRDMDIFNKNFLEQSYPSSQSSGSRERFVSRISYTDANTLQIELPCSGVDANVLFSGAFSALWFSAVGPATLGMLSGGIAPALFMVPFWLAGGMVAKTAIFDPFVSSKLTIGDNLWTLEKNYFQRRVNLTSKMHEGPSETFKGASVEVGMVVNNFPRYELRLVFDRNTISFGKGLIFDELDFLAKTINEHCAKIGDIPRLQH